MTTLYTHAKHGIALAIASNLLFAVFYVYSDWLAPMTGTEVFVWRVLTMWCAIVFWLLASGQWQGIKDELKPILISPKQLMALLLGVPIMLSQMWLFMWAPVNGQGVEVAMGYFLYPLVMVLFGCVFFKERLNAPKRLAVTLAAMGVLLALVDGGGLSWATFWVCGTFPIYYVLRRSLPLRPLGGLLVDSTLFLPLGLGYLWLYSKTQSVLLSPIVFAKVFGLGAISLVAFMANLRAIKLLPVSIFGMLSYLEPLLLFVLAITILGEPLDLNSLFSYGLIALGIACLIADGAIKKQPKTKS